MCSSSSSVEVASNCVDGDVPKDDPVSQRLFRTFLLFSNSERRLSSEQTHFILNELLRIQSPGQPAKRIPNVVHSNSISYSDFVRTCELLFPDHIQFGPLVDRLFERYVSQIIFKGFVMCRRVERLKSCIWKSHKWRMYWCTANPGAIYLWPLHKPTTLSNRRKITLTPATTVNMQLAITHQTKNDLLEYDRKRAAEAEYPCVTEKNLTWRLALESENSRLMKLLDEERRALHDEEIVRTLATRMFDEEREKREKLERKLNDMESKIKKNRSFEDGIEENIKRQLREVRRQQLHASTKSL